MNAMAILFRGGDDLRLLFLSLSPLGYSSSTRNYFAYWAAMKRHSVSVSHLVPRSSRRMILDQLDAGGELAFLSPAQFKKSVSSKAYDGILVFGKKTWVFLRSNITGRLFRLPPLFLTDRMELSQYQFSPDFYHLYRCALSLESALVVGQVGELSKKNNQNFSLEVLRHLLKINKKSRLLIVGDGSLRMELKAQIDYEYLPVLMPGDTLSLHTMLTAMDVLLFPNTKIDPFLLEEALSAGLTCLVPEHAAGIKDTEGIVKLDLNAGLWSETIAALNMDTTARAEQSKNFLDDRSSSSTGESELIRALFGASSMQL
jgi:glycosyltransferase involved in cell wall biosynthesis